MPRKCKNEWCYNPPLGVEKQRVLVWLNGWCDSCYASVEGMFGRYDMEDHNPDEPEWFKAP